jgi:hypothetical protein
MARLLDAGTARASAVSRSSFLEARPAYQAYQLLHIGFAALPILAGLDKFVDVLGNWDKYLAPLVTRLLPLSAHTFMMVELCCNTRPKGDLAKIGYYPSSPTCDLGTSATKP